MKRCKYCGKGLERKQKSYCSRACRNKDNPRVYKERPHIPKTCPVCGKEYLSTRRDRIYCSQKCNDVAKRDRREKRPQPGQTHWRKKRHEIFENQEGLCWLCENEMDHSRFDVHHLVNDHDLFSNDLVALHKECHMMMHRVHVIVNENGIRFEGKALDLLRRKGYEI